MTKLDGDLRGSVHTGPVPRRLPRRHAAVTQSFVVGGGKGYLTASTYESGTYVRTFVNMRADPSGVTNDPQPPHAYSVMDYVARRLATDHLSIEARHRLGILTADEQPG